MDLLERPAHPAGVQAELSSFLEAHRKRAQARVTEAPPEPVGGPVTQRVREQVQDADSKLSVTQKAAAWYKAPQDMTPEEYAYAIGN